MQYIVAVIALLLLSVNQVYAGQGCCSWHSGECGCSASGRTICCDGTLSPSCTCSSYIPLNNYVYPTNTPTPFYYTPPVTKYCGAGNAFYTQKEATTDLEKYKNNVIHEIALEVNPKVIKLSWFYLASLITAIALMITGSIKKNDNWAEHVFYLIIFYGVIASFIAIPYAWEVFWTYLAG